MEERNKWGLSRVNIKALHKKCVYWVTTTELSILLKKQKKGRKKKQTENFAITIWRGTKPS